MTVELIQHINFYIFPMALLVIVSVGSIRASIKNTEDRIFFRVLVFTCAAMVFDITSIIFMNIPGQTARVLCIASNVLYYCAVPMIGLSWLSYSHFVIYNRTLINTGSYYSTGLLVIMASYYALVLSSPLSGTIFYVNKYTNYISIGTYTKLPYILLYLLLIASTVICIKAALTAEFYQKRKHCRFLSAFILFPTIGTITQQTSDVMLLSLPMTTLAVMLVYLLAQNNHITVDSLTRLNNRGSFDKHIKARCDEKTSSKTWYLFMLDVDDFKSINDTYGHQVGDQILKSTADVLRQAFGKTDAFIARYGGDEFAIIKNCNSFGEASEQISILDRALAHFSKTDTMPCPLTISCGFCRCPDEISEYDSNTMNDMIEVADQMMYENKKRRA